MFEQKSIGDTLLHFNTDRKQGLSTKESEERLLKYGENKLAEEKKKSLIFSFWEQLNDPLIYVLLVAASISLFLKEISDAIIIIAVILLNAIIGLVQEGKAQKALEALKNLTSPHAIVKRNGKEIEIQATQLVLGDIVCLDAGRLIPADLRLIKTNNLLIEDSALTGESIPVEKDATFLANLEIPLGDRKNMAYMSTMVTSGRGEGIVVATGMQTEIGKIASMIHNTPQELTPLQKRLGDLGKLLSILSVILCIALFFIALIQKRNLFHMLLTAISLAVAAVPEGLPAVVTIVLALSVSRMVKVNTIIRKLPSVETLGAVSVVCSDKTGTLTQNKMTVTKCYANQQLFELKHMDEEVYKDFFLGMLLCNDAILTSETRIGDPTELALLYACQTKGLFQEDFKKYLPRIQEKGFDSIRKMMTTLHKSGNSYLSYTKGAPDEILKRCKYLLVKGSILPLDHYEKKKIQSILEDMSSQALRVLAIAMKKENSLNEENLIFIGLAGMIDPAREEATFAVQKFKEASVDTVMITGDHIDTAFAIGKQLGIAKTKGECMSGKELDTLSDSELQGKLPYIKVFARVSPEHKVKIVQGFKKMGKIVAMTGDGVNDAPSLKAADIGIAMGKNGTDVAKSASSLILTDDNFATIEKAIEEGRSIYENIKKSVLFLLSSNFGEIITMFAAVLAFLPTPLKATHILWVNLITDSLPALALGVDQNDKNELMKHPPRKSGESLFANGGLSCTLFYGILIASISLVAFLTLPITLMHQENISFTWSSVIRILQQEDILNRAQTYSFTVLCLSQLFHAIGMRDISKSIFRMNHFTNPTMLSAFVVGFLLQIAVTKIPYLIKMFGTASLSFQEWICLLLLSTFPLLAHEILILTAVPFATRKKLEVSSN